VVGERLVELGRDWDLTLCATGEGWTLRLESRHGGRSSVHTYRGPGLGGVVARAYHGEPGDPNDPTEVTRCAG